MDAKRRALESIVMKQAIVGADQTEDSRTENGAKNVGYPHQPLGFRNGQGENTDLQSDCPESPTTTHDFEGEYPQKSPQSVVSESHRGLVRSRKSKKIFGSSGRTRTYNPSVNSRMLCH